GLTFPLIIPTIGALTAIAGVYLTKGRKGESALVTINRGFYISALVAASVCAVAAFIFLPGEIEGLDLDPSVRVAAAVIIGIILAAFILWLTGYFTGTESKPTNTVAKTSLTGPATVVLSGIGVGFESAVYTAATIAGAVFLLFTLG